MQTILSVENLSVSYPSGDIREVGLKEYLFRRIRGGGKVERALAVKGISFSLSRGELLGIVGGNGAGKSTLLKAVSGVLKPSAGRVIRHGVQATLLELGSGFDGELSVWENVFLRGALLGYTRDFMKRMAPEILRFAELEGVRERQFKHLSSGMRSRLAFSIASLVEPDLLILDEVLAVGDGAFRQKSEERMRRVIASGTATVLVSHSLRELRELATKILWLSHGECVYYGEDVKGALAEYEDQMKKK